MDTRPRVVDTTSRQTVILRRISEPIFMRAGIFAVLEVPGRRTGAPMRAKLGVYDLDGSLYLLSQYGETHWVRNLRAAGGGKLQRKGQTLAFTATEVDGAERDRVIAEFYRHAHRWLRRDFEQLPSEDHPAFRVDLSEGQR